MRYPSFQIILEAISLLLHLVLLICIPTDSLNITTDEYALLALKSHITPDANSSFLLQNWTSNTSPCNWIGIKCSNLHNRVVALNISYLGLLGTIPLEIGNLSFLKSMVMVFNNFQGNLPGEIVNLRRLKHLNLNVNNFSGEIPSWIGSLPNLVYLNLGNNSFTGVLPSSLCNASKLEALIVSSNYLEGYIPQEIGNLGNLIILDMQYNQLVGTLPLSILNISSLQDIAFTQNRLSGILPMNICSNLQNLQGIYLSLNGFSGEIKSRFNNCSQLQIISLSFNNFSGPIPSEISNLTMLVDLVLGSNEFNGELPSALGNLLNLELLHIAYASLYGSVPVEIGNLQKLRIIALDANSLTGSIPASIFNISSLTDISFSANNLYGILQLSTEQHIPNLEKLLLGENELSGVVLDSISNFTNLMFLDLGTNKFSGSIPTSLGDLRSLEYLQLENNLFTSDSSGELMSFLAALTNCRSLGLLGIGQNPLNGTILPVLGNFSSSFEKFLADSSGLTGKIPDEIGNLTGLVEINVANNNLTGVLPSTFQMLSNLQALDVHGNKIAGFIPNGFCNLNDLSILNLRFNQFSGQVPECFGGITSLRYLYLGSNQLNSTFPVALMRLTDLLDLDIHSNYFSGDVTPAVGNLMGAEYIDFSDNGFSGNIPASFGDLQNLIDLLLDHNQLQGPIPGTFGSMLSLEWLDLSFNNLNGEIPTSLESLLQLKYFNVSFNHLRGEVPRNGPFTNLTNQSFVSNDALCGGPPQLHFDPCASNSPQGSRSKRLSIIAYVLVPISFIVILVVSILLMFQAKRRKNKSPAQVDSIPSTTHKRVSYYELENATNSFSETNLNATGTLACVYKGVLKDGTNVAIKVFTLLSEGAVKSFEIECEIIRSIRHRNIVKVIGSCSNHNFKALVLEYMPNGSLEMWLYSHNNFLDFLQRLDIMIDVASALDYLHHGYTSPIVHCDLKPSNILLDDQMVGHVRDFGISKLFDAGESMERTKTLATIGYLAPEYGFEGIVSTKSDMYSFGILLMETFSRKKPTDEMFAESLGLKEWIMETLQNSATDFIDHNLLTSKDKSLNLIARSARLVMELALRCSVDSPALRTDTRQALAELEKAKMLYLSNATLKE